jgi:transcriptional regulator with XRE-family HTH domain
MTLGELLRARRLALDLSLDEVAGATGTTKSTLHRVEVGKTEPGILVCARLSVALGVSVQAMASAALAGAMGRTR